MRLEIRKQGIISYLRSPLRS